MLDTSKTAPSVDAWLREAKADPTAAECGMYLTHNGTVRATPKSEARGVETDGVAPGKKVGGMLFSYDAAKVQTAIGSALAMPGIKYVRVWLADGQLAVGDDNNMLCLQAKALGFSANALCKRSGIACV